MNKLIVTTVLMLATSVVMAMASPKQIEDALAAKDYNSAKQMISEVLKEKPNSARAHLLNAEIAIAADHNKQLAVSELNIVKALDKNGDVTASPLFGRVVAEVDLMKDTTKGDTKGVVKGAHAPQKPIEDDSISFLTVLAWMFGLTLLVAIIWYFTRPKKQVYPSVNSGSILSSVGNTSANTSYPSRPTHSYYDPTPAHVVSPVVMQGNQGMGAFSTAASVAGGTVAGNLMSDALLHRSSHSSSSNHNDSYDNDNYVAPSKSSSYSSPSYDTERSSYSSSSSSSSSWDSGSSSSSSWDSGSSSSYDSGSSWD